LQTDFTKSDEEIKLTAREASPDKISSFPLQQTKKNTPRIIPRNLLVNKKQYITGVGTIAKQ